MVTVMFYDSKNDDGNGLWSASRIMLKTGQRLTNIGQDWLKLNLSNISSSDAAVHPLFWTDSNETTLFQCLLLAEPTIFFYKKNVF